MNFKSKLNQGFANIRKEGYFAKQNFWCCQSCACAAIPDENAKAYVFYHQQDADGLREDKSEDKGIYLAWAGDPMVIRRAFEYAGCKVEHDGDIKDRIWVCDAPSPTVETGPS